MCFVEDNIAHFKKLMTIFFARKRIDILILLFSLLSRPRQ